MLQEGRRTTIAASVVEKRCGRKSNVGSDVTAAGDIAGLNVFIDERKSCRCGCRGMRDFLSVDTR